MRPGGLPTHAAAAAQQQPPPLPELEHGRRHHPVPTTAKSVIVLVFLVTLLIIYDSAVWNAIRRPACRRSLGRAAMLQHGDLELPGDGASGRRAG